MAPERFDFVLDFSASWSGGGLRRLEACVRHVGMRGIKALFLVHPAASDVPRRARVCYVVLRRSAFSRFLPDVRLWRMLAGRAAVYLSYGIPISLRIGQLNCLHLTNALPFGYGACRVTMAERLKNSMLRTLFRMYQAHDMVSGESQYMLALYRSSMGWSGPQAVFRNGTDEELLRYRPQPAGDRCAVTIGTQGYKRLDRVYRVYNELRSAWHLGDLVIVGDCGGIPADIARREDVCVVGLRPHPETLKLLAESAVFISASEIENSSNAVLEAVRICPESVLSSIPAHAEMLRPESCSTLRVDGREYIVAPRGALRPESDVDWTRALDSMFTQLWDRCSGRSPAQE